jgi:hypothetical protein
MTSLSPVADSPIKTLLHADILMSFESMIAMAALILFSTAVTVSFDRSISKAWRFILKTYKAKKEVEISPAARTAHV